MDSSPGEFWELCSKCIEKVLCLYLSDFCEAVVLLFKIFYIMQR